MTKKTVVTKLRETRLTMAKHNLMAKLDKSNWLKKPELKYMTTVHNTTQE